MKEAFHQIIGRCSELVSRVSVPRICVSPPPSDPQTHSPWGTLSQDGQGICGLQDPGVQG